MTASLLQLVAIGNEDYMICGNPQMTFWKNVYLKYTNFSIERVENLPITSSKYNYDSHTEIIFKINQNYGDMIGKVIFSIEFPDIYSHYPYNFKWISNIGNYIIKNAYLIINDKIIETIDSNVINIYNETNTNLKNESINSSIISIDNTYDYVSNNKKNNDYTISNIDKIDENYSHLPSINSKKIYIDIPFFFNKNKAYLPVNCLDKSDIKIKLDLRPINELFIISKPETIITKKDSYELFNYDNPDTYTEYKYNRYYAPKMLDNINITDFLKEKDFFSNIDMSLISYTYFLDRNENIRMKKQKQEILINRFVRYKDVSSISNTTLNIEDNNIVSEIIVVPQRNDVDQRNEWNNYGINDYNIQNINVKNYTNYFFKLCLQQYNSDLEYIKNKNKEYSDVVNKILSREHFTVNIFYNKNSGVHHCISLNENEMEQVNYYLSFLNIAQDDILSPLFYYGMFKNPLDYNFISINPELFNYKVLNQNYRNTKIDQLKYVPSIYYNYNNIYLYFNKPLSTNSVLDSVLYIEKHNCISDTDILSILNTWNRRTHTHIPIIDDSNYSYFYPDNIIKSIDIDIKGAKIINKLDTNNLYKTILYSNYKSFRNIDNIIRYNFALNPLNNQPSGHLNLESIDRLNINLELKDIATTDSKVEDQKIIFYIYLSTINKLIINDNKIKLEI